MTIQSFDPTALPPVSVTPAAAEHFARQLQTSGRRAVRLGLKSAGCTGYKYVLEEVDGEPEDHVAQALDNGVLLYVDRASLPGLKDLLIDIRKQGMNFNLVMDNPNIQDECGCGESFNFDNGAE